jgi:hypothetical protein
VKQTQSELSGPELIFHGPWSSSECYDGTAAITHKGALYRALKPNQGVEPGSDAGTWKLLAKPKPTTPGAEMERVKLGLANLGYNDIERDSIRFLLEPGEVIEHFDPWSISTNRRMITRESIRPLLRPASWTRIETWDSQFPKIPERSEELAANRR